MIEPFIDETMDAVHTALEGVGLGIGDLSEVLLVGGALAAHEDLAIHEAMDALSDLIFYLESQSGFGEATDYGALPHLSRPTGSLGSVPPLRPGADSAAGG